MSEYLYTYVPKDNTVDRDGLLSTRLAKHGWEKYMGRTNRRTRNAVLHAIDNWKPGFKRSYAISGLTEPIPADAHKDFRGFADSQRLYRFDAAKLLAAGLLTKIEYAPPRTFRLDEVDRIDSQEIDWKKRPRGLLFKDIPHYLVEAANGSIPPEYVEEVDGK